MNMWFTKLIKQFFFWIDKIVYNFIPTIYDLLLDIARTSILSQTDIADMADRIYKLLAIFMIFKVTLSLITYVVNPDDFSDKSKGVAKLGTNIIISLSLLILTPYIFNYAYQIQTIILEDNSLATLVFGGDETKESFFNTAGDSMAYTTLSAFFSPNLSLGNLHECSTMYDPNDSDKINPRCSNELNTLVNDNFNDSTYKNYIAGVEKRNLGLMFRQDVAVATNEDNTDFIIEYKFIFSTVVGVVIILLLITFCMDIAVRSLKLAFLQLVSPIPILSYVDPKSGKDGLFKKWYEMCFKTFLSLFVRLLALYFAVYIISIVADLKMVDIIDGSYQRNIWVAIFVIIGALMFAKQLPKILEGLGIKLDGDGKFTLNPLKKFEEGALGGKRITGAVGGMAAGLIGGHGVAGRIGSMFTGAARGFAANKGYKGGLDRQADVNRKLRESRIAGAGFWGSRVAVLSSRYGLDDADLEKRATNLRKNKREMEIASRKVDSEVKQKEAEKKRIEDGMASQKRVIEKNKRMQEAISSMEKRAKEEIEGGRGGDIGKEYLTRKAHAEYLENNIGKEITLSDGTKTHVTSEMAAEAKIHANNWLSDEGMKLYMSQASTGTFSDGKDDKTFKNYYKTYLDASAVIGISSSTSGADMHRQLGESKGLVGDIERDLAPDESKIKDINDEIRNIQATTEVMIDGEPMSYEKAKAQIEKEEKELKEIQERRKLNRGLAKDSRIGGGS